MSSKKLQASEARAPLEGTPQAMTAEDQDSNALEIIYSTGWRVWFTVLGVAMATAATNMEVSVIGTSLVKIAEDLHGFERQGWVVTAYLITYTSVGAAGSMSCGVAMIYDLVPKRKVPTYNALVTAFSAMGGLVGPIIGGAFSQAGQWRWSFLIK
ncbi:MAG: hypothetical protein Q9227_000443 [Pyrenula ochraceoflavens]